MPIEGVVSSYELTQFSPFVFVELHDLVTALRVRFWEPLFGLATGGFLFPCPIPKLVSFMGNFPTYRGPWYSGLITRYPFNVPALIC